jgi:cytochrome P450
MLEWATTLAGREETFPTTFATMAEVLRIPEEDRVWVEGWFDTILHSAPASSESARARTSITAYFGDLVATRRRMPGNDLVSALATAGDRQLAATLFELVLAGLGAPRGLVAC